MTDDGAGTTATELANRRDPGLQPERTRLAWRRTTLSATVVAVLALKSVLQSGQDALAVTAAALCMLLWVAFLALAHHRVAALAGRSPGEHRAMPVPVALAATACVVALAACATPLVR